MLLVYSFLNCTSNAAMLKTISFFYLRIGRPQSNKSQSKKDYYKNKDALKKKEQEHKKVSREYECYVCPEKCKQRVQNDWIRSMEYRTVKKLNQNRPIKHHHHLLKKPHQQRHCNHLRVNLVRNNIFIFRYRKILIE